MRCARHHHQFGITDRPIHRDGVLKLDLVVVADHDERPALHLTEVSGRERRLVRVHPGQLVDDDLVVTRAIRRHLLVQPRHELRRLIARIDDMRQPAVVVEHARDQHQTIDEVWPSQRGEQPDDRAVTAADQVRRPPDNCLQKRDRVLCHRSKGDRARDIWRMPVTAPLGRVDVKASGQRADVRAKRSGIDAGPSRVKEDERIPLAVLIKPGANTTKGHVVSHRVFLQSSLQAVCVYDPQVRRNSSPQPVTAQPA